jgi:type VI secretion system secreted protein VgrG
MTFNSLPANLAGLLPLASLTGANRPIRLRLSDTEDDLLLVKHVSGTETICGGIEYRLLCVSMRAGLPTKQFIARPAEVQFATDTGDLRSVCGIVAEAAEGQSDGGLATYQLVIRDALAIMELRTNTRVFRNASEIDISQAILSEWCQRNPVLARAFEFDLGQLRDYPAREFTMQYNESDAAFLRRLWKRRGIAWFIQPGKASGAGDDTVPAHTLVLFDDAMALQQNAAGTVRYHRDDGTETRDSITAWHAVRSLSAGKLSRQSWDYMSGQMSASDEAGRNDQGEWGNQLAASLDDYLVDVPHAGDSSTDYRSLGMLRMLRHEYESKCYRGEGGVRDLCIGQWIGVTGHVAIDAHPPEEREFVITELHVDAENNLPKNLNDKARRLFAINRWRGDGQHAALDQVSEERGVRYTNQFSCVRRGIAIVPAYDPRIDLPRTEAQSVIVVGPPGEEVHCDELGRVKIRFPACRAEDHDSGAGASGSERDSAWVRIAGTWASRQWGAISLPRAGDECIVTFLGGDPDKPIITGRVHGGTTPPPTFSHAGGLPGNRYLSGIKSKEVQGARYNQLRMDDTPDQISAQLASEHGHSELNLGYLTEPRYDGQASPRGEGAELRSDHTVAIKGAQGIYISADTHLRAAGRQLERDGLTGLANALQSIQQQLAELAGTHHADDGDGKPLSQLIGHLKQWEKGSNTDGGKHNAAGGQPIVAIDAPAGAILGSSDNIAIGAQTHVDIVSVGNTQLSAGRKLLLHAAQSVSVFAHKLGMKFIAAAGKIDMQAHQDDIALTAAKRIVLSAADEIIIQAPKVSIISQGAQAVYGGGAVNHQLTGAYAIKSATFAHSGPGDASPQALHLPKSKVQTDEKFIVRYIGSNAPVKGASYTITLNNGNVISGKTNAKGETELSKEQEMLIADIEIRDDV